MTQKEFERLVAEETATIPEKFRVHLENVVFVAEDEPTTDELEEAGIPESETLLGVQEGPTLGERKSYPWHLPNRIILFRIPHEEEAEEAGVEVRSVVRDTIWHEVAHFLGMDEREVRAAENRRVDR